MNTKPEDLMQFVELSDEKLRDSSREYVKIQKLITEFNSLQNDVALATRRSKTLDPEVALLEMGKFAADKLPILLRFLAETALFMDAYYLKRVAIRKNREEIINRFKADKLKEMEHPADALGPEAKITRFVLSDEDKDTLAWFESPSINEFISQLHIFDVETRRAEARKRHDEQRLERRTRALNKRNAKRI